MKRRRMVAPMALALALAMGAGAYAIEWPMAEARMESTFGTLREGRFLPGIEISAEDPAVLCAAAGEVLFCEDGAGPGGLPSGVGSFVAIAHERGLVSVYGGLEPGTAVDYLREARQGDLLGLAAAERGGEAGLRFFLFDAEKGQFVNPLLFLRPREDQRTPAVRAVYLRRDSQAIDLSQIRTLRQGLCEVQAEFWDPRDDGQGYNAPFQVRVLLNGSERISLGWDIGREIDGRYRLFSGEGKSVDEFFVPPARYRLGTIQIPRGRASLEIIVSDFSQRSRSSSYVFQVE